MKTVSITILPDTIWELFESFVLEIVPVEPRELQSRVSGLGYDQL